MDNFNFSVLNFIHLFGSNLIEILLTFDDEVLEEAYLRTVLIHYGGTGTPFL